MYGLKDLYCDYVGTDDYLSFQPAKETQLRTDAHIRHVIGEEQQEKIADIIAERETEIEMQGFFHGFRLGMRLMSEGLK